jgi:hypothetical protein
MVLMVSNQGEQRQSTSSIMMFVSSFMGIHWYAEVAEEKQTDVHTNMKIPWDAKCS